MTAAGHRRSGGRRRPWWRHVARSTARRRAVVVLVAGASAGGVGLVLERLASGEQRVGLAEPRALGATDGELASCGADGRIGLGLSLARRRGGDIGPAGRPPRRPAMGRHGGQARGHHRRRGRRRAASATARPPPKLDRGRGGGHAPAQVQNRTEQLAGEWRGDEDPRQELERSMRVGDDDERQADGAQGRSDRDVRERPRGRRPLRSRASTRARAAVGAAVVSSRMRGGGHAARGCPAHGRYVSPASAPGRRRTGRRGLRANPQREASPARNPVPGVNRSGRRCE